MNASPTAQTSDRQWLLNGGVTTGFILLLFIVWHLIALQEWVPAYLFPTPIEVLKSLASLLADGKLFDSIGASLSRMAIGYGISVVGGLLLGTLIATSWLAKQTIGKLVMALQSLPSICWLPFALLWVGLNEQAVLFVIVLGAMFSIALSTENAILNISPIYLKVGRTLGAKSWILNRDILFFAALPELIGGLKVGWTFAWRALMAAELLRSDLVGVGHLLEVGRSFNDISMMMASILIILAIGLIADGLIFGTAERIIRRRYGLQK